MNLQEAGEVLFALKTAYPNSFNKMSNEDGRRTAGVWASMFSETDGREVLQAVQAYVLTNESKFPPTIGEVNALIAKKKTGNHLGELEAWGLVRKAISNSAWDSDKEFAKLPEVIRKAVGHPSTLKEWALMDTNTVDSVVSSNFMRTYRAKLKHADFEAKLPQKMLEDWGNKQDLLLGGL